MGHLATSISLHQLIPLSWKFIPIQSFLDSHGKQRMKKNRSTREYGTKNRNLARVAKQKLRPELGLSRILRSWDSGGWLVPYSLFFEMYVSIFLPIYLSISILGQGVSLVFIIKLKARLTLFNIFILEKTQILGKIQTSVDMALLLLLFTIQVPA